MKFQISEFLAFFAGVAVYGYSGEVAEAADSLRMLQQSPSFCNRSEYEDFHKCAEDILNIDFENITDIDTQAEFCNFVEDILSDVIVCVENACNAKCKDHKNEFQEELNLLAGLFNCTFGDVCDLESGGNGALTISVFNNALLSTLLMAALLSQWHNLT